MCSTGRCLSDRSLTRPEWRVRARTTPRPHSQRAAPQARAAWRRGASPLAALIWDWWAADDERRVAPLLIAGSALAIVYFLFRVPRTLRSTAATGALSDKRSWPTLRL